MTSAWSQHLYSYTGNKPINYFDPTGHFYYYKNTQVACYGDPKILSMEFSFSVYFTGDALDDTSRMLALAGMNDWNQSNVFDLQHYCYYNLRVNIDTVENIEEANLIVNIQKAGRIDACGISESHALPTTTMKGVIRGYTMANGTIYTPEIDEIHMYKADGGFFQEDVRHEFSHVFRLEDAYPVAGEYEADEDAPLGSVMTKPYTNPVTNIVKRNVITPYDLGIIFGKNDNYVRTPITE